MSSMAPRGTHLFQNIEIHGEKMEYPEKNAQLSIIFAKRFNRCCRTPNTVGPKKCNETVDRRVSGITSNDTEKFFVDEGYGNTFFVILLGVPM